MGAGRALYGNVIPPRKNISNDNATPVWVAADSPLTSEAMIRPVPDDIRLMSKISPKASIMPRKVTQNWAPYKNPTIKTIIKPKNESVHIPRTRPMPSFQGLTGIELIFRYNPRSLSEAIDPAKFDCPANITRKVIIVSVKPPFRFGTIAVGTSPYMIGKISKKKIGVINVQIISILFLQNSLKVLSATIVMRFKVKTSS